MFLLRLLGWCVCGYLLPSGHLIMEILALRQQLAAYQRQFPKPRVNWKDRCFWVPLRRIWSGWQAALVIVQPATVIRWHRAGFRMFWHWKSRRKKPGRPTISRDLIVLIRRMAKENSTWGATRIQAELALLGHDLAETTVAKYLPNGRRPPSQTWKTFFHNHMNTTAAVDFFLVPTATFRLFHMFVVMCHERRDVFSARIALSINADFWR